MAYLNTPYKWGGNNYLGLDCSGLVLKAMHDYGITLPDMTSQGIHDWALRKFKQSCEPSEDCLLFFGSSNKKITHIAISINNEYMIEAGGAGRDSLTEDAEYLARIDARVRIKPISNRRDFVASYKFDKSLL